MNDPLSAKDQPQSTLCGQLHTATICTTDIAQYATFFGKGMEMTMDGPLEMSAEKKAIQRQIWDIPFHIDYDVYHIHRPNIPSLIQIRLLHLKHETPHIHKSYSSRELGPFSLGFPNGDQRGLDKKLMDMNVDVMADMQEGEIPRPDGTTYRYWETIYKGPDFLHCVGIERGDGMSQLAPIDEETKLGGPGYSAFVTNQSDAELAFYTEVLGLELRADRYWEASPGSALGINEGVEFRFSLVYAPGTSQNHLLFLDYQDGIFEDTGVKPRLPNQGLGMWSFKCSDLDLVIENAHKNNVQIIHKITNYADPITGSKQAFTLLTPSGFLIELFDR